jgi:hypothetical protein
MPGRPTDEDREIDAFGRETQETARQLARVFQEMSWPWPNGSPTDSDALAALALLRDEIDKASRITSSHREEAVSSGRLVFVTDAPSAGAEVWRVCVEIGKIARS